MKEKHTDTMLNMLATGLVNQRGLEPGSDVIDPLSPLTLGLEANALGWEEINMHANPG